MPEPREFDIEVVLDGEPLSVLSHGRLNGGPDAGLTVVHCTHAHDDPTAERLVAAEALLRDPEMFTVGADLRSRIDAFLASGGVSDA